MTPLPRTPLDEILEIPGNRSVFEDLQKLLAEKKAIAFVGAGASAGMYPLWGEFIGKLADFAVEKSKAEPKDRDRWKADRTSTPQQRVNTILRKLGEDYYRQFLRETFAPRYGGDGKRYTPIHAMLLRLPFRGFVTTNYDPALEFARMELRPGSLTTGTPTWQDDEEVHRWLTGDVFEPAGACPILWLHGYWQRPSGIVLNAGEYATVYRPGLYRKTFQRLWEQDHLVFAGFGFNDPQFTFMVGEILRDIAGAHAEPRHIAILGLQLDEDGNLPDPEAIAEGRANMEADYHVRPLFYRVKPLPSGGQDHSDLYVLLEALASADARPVAAPARVAVPSPTASTTTLPSRWVHETTNDEKFTGREDERTRLDRWVADPVVRVIGITAVGGTGKTALTGHWLKNTTGWRSRPFEGLFAWSFYQERNNAAFLRALLEWAHETFGTSTPDDRTDLVPAALKLLRMHTLVVVLDGLEVLQEGPEAARYGTFLDGTLREFLGGLCSRQHESLAVLTSRFVFADLERHLGTALHQLELPGLAPEQGAALLTELEVRGTEMDREDVSRRLEGHPLGLRVFAEAIPEARRDQPREFLNDAFRTGQLSPDSPLAGKVRRLLAFYEKNLTLTQVRLLGVVALFRTPVTEETTLRLARGLFAEHLEPLPGDAVLTGELRRLHVRGVLTREPIDGGHGYACHPILRDHFRSVLLGSGAATARRAADLLQGQPSGEQARSVKSLEPVLLAIELLLEAGELRAADALYQDRLENGYLFKWIPAILEGLRCALGFVLDERRQKCEEQLSETRLSFYLNEAGLFAIYSGQYELAARSYAQADAIDHTRNNVKGLSIGLQNEAELSVFLGRLGEAANQATEALRLARELGSEMGIRTSSNAYRGWARALSGQVRAASEDFATANVLEKEDDPNGEELYSNRGTQWAELLFRTGHSALATRRTAANLQLCRRYGWNEDIARCRSVLGACALAEGRLNDADVELLRAEPAFHSGQMLFELAKLHVTAGFVALARRDTAAALHRAAEALALAQPREMRLVHADALVLRGRARLLDAVPDRALDDAEDALRLARDCGYAWAERDALTLQADAHTALGHRDAAHRARSEADALSARLRLTEEDLAEADAKAEAWLQEWERENKKTQ
jgi:SIR2-like domain